MVPFLTRSRAQQSHVCFLLCFLLSLVILRPTLTSLITLSLGDDRYSHILIIPIISITLLYLMRASVFNALSFGAFPAMLLLIPGLIALGITQRIPWPQGSNYRLSLQVLAMVLIWITAFVQCYGKQSFQTAAFPLLFLLLMVPLPLAVLDGIVDLLQKGSAELAYALFRLVDIPVFRNGFTFTLPGVDIEVAKECSGIRSTVALLITGILAGHVFLSSGWRKVLVALLTIPIAILKNAVRIVTISWLGVYVDRGFLYGKLHHYGGIPFALVALAILGPTLVILRKTEASTRKKSEDSIHLASVTKTSLGFLTSSRTGH
jgi:exosortase